MPSLCSHFASSTHWEASASSGNVASLIAPNTRKARVIQLVISPHLAGPREGKGDAINLIPPLVGDSKKATFMYPL